VLNSGPQLAGNGPARDPRDLGLIRIDGLVGIELGVNGDIEVRVGIFHGGEGGDDFSVGVVDL
jgi:hypothetical protein